MRIRLKLLMAFLAVASLVALVGFLSWSTHQEIGLQIEQLSRSSIIGLVDASEMAIALHNSHAASHEYLDAKRARQEDKLADAEPGHDAEHAEFTIHASLISFERSLRRSRQANQAMIAWRNQHRTTGEDPSSATKNRETLRRLQEKLTGHRQLVKQFMAICAADPQKAQVFLESNVESQFNHEMLPLIRAYGAASNSEFTDAIRNVERSLARANQRNTIFTIIACLIAGILGLVIARSIAKPLTKLKKAAVQVGKGNFYVPIEVKSQDEVGILAEAFRQMVGDLQATTISRAYVDSIVRSMIEMLIVVDPQMQIRKVNTALRRQLGLTNEEVLGRELSLVWPDGPKYVLSAARLKEDLRAGIESEFADAEGTKLPVFVNGSELRDESENVQGIVLTASNISERKQAEAQLRASLREKEVLLKEVHHRVKNNLQIISSLLNLQAKEADQPAATRVCQNSQRRIRSMALIHEQLYKSDDLSQIDFQAYVVELSRQLSNTLTTNDGRIAIALDVDGVMLDIDKAIPCGMIVNELVTNAIEHAFPGDCEGTITVTFQRADGKCVLSVADNGAGLPDAFAPASSASLGLRVVDLLAKQLGGTLSVSNHQGAAFTIEFADATPTETTTPP